MEGSANPTQPGRRIAVVGTSCGKTYVAQQLAEKLCIPYVSNDAIIWRPHWQETPRHERLAAVDADAATKTDSWTFDGNIAARHPEDRLVLDRCDTIVWLDLPRHEVLSQVVTRTVRRVLRREELWRGNRESLRMMFSRNSIVLDSMTSFARRRRAYDALFQDPALNKKVLIRLRSRRGVHVWLSCIYRQPKSHRQLA